MTNRPSFVEPIAAYFEGKTPDSVSSGNHNNVDCNSKNALITSSDSTVYATIVAVSINNPAPTARRDHAAIRMRFLAG